MRHLHLEKHGLRGLAIAESFSQTSKKSVLSGIVMSTDLIIDGFVLGHSTVGGDDATEAILSMYEKLDRPDISFFIDIRDRNITLQHSRCEKNLGKNWAASNWSYI